MTEVNVTIDIGDAVETALGDIDVSDYIDMEYAVDNALSGMDLNDYIDNDDIRYHIEDDILSQVNDHIDNDDIRWSLEGHFRCAGTTRADGETIGSHQPTRRPTINTRDNHTRTT